MLFCFVSGRGLLSCYLDIPVKTCFLLFSLFVASYEDHARGNVLLRRSLYSLPSIFVVACCSKHFVMRVC